MNAVLEITAGTQVNEEHRLARQCADFAIEHAIKCGELLAEKKAALKHGEFEPWIEVNCEFSIRSAQAYMKAATQKRRGLRFSSLKEALGYDKKKEPPVPEEEPEEIYPDGTTRSDHYEEWCTKHEEIDETEPSVEVITVADSARSVADYCAEQAIQRLNDLKLNDPGAVEAITRVTNHCKKLLRRIK